MHFTDLYSFVLKPLMKRKKTVQILPSLQNEYDNYASDFKKIFHFDKLNAIFDIIYEVHFQ